MNRLAYAALLALLSLSFAPRGLTAADTNGPSASGNYEVSIDNGRKSYIEFNVRTERDGSITGESTFRDREPVSDPKLNGAPTISESPAPFYMKAEFDCLTVKDNKAVMSGTVTESSSERYVGKRMLLVVQDNGDGTKSAARDKLTWGVYTPTARWWFPTDSERPDDEGVSKWTATDAERPDDEGVPSQKSEEIGCQTYPLSSYSFIDAKHGSGNIQVRP